VAKFVNDARGALRNYHVDGRYAYVCSLGGYAV